MSKKKYIPIFKAAERLNTSVATIYASRRGQEAIVPSTHTQVMVDWTLLSNSVVVRIARRKHRKQVEREPAIKEKIQKPKRTKVMAEPKCNTHKLEPTNPYWLRRGPTDSLGTSSSSLEAGAYIG